ncbi:MAG: UDP-N-acetylglucosamine-1-phosphate transferase [Candidatus Thermoplasmatota archaeon]|nr:UDP-N-acetylglucosamine-1-phosphate transferase [Candidatus Thermoplasmatota archaeon]
MHPLVPMAVSVLALVVVLLVEPYFNIKLKSGGFVAQDMYKRGKVMLPNKGGLLILFGALVALIVASVVFRVVNFASQGDPLPRGLTSLDEALLYTMLIFAFYGVLDDYINVGRVSKILLPIFFSYPIVTALVFQNPSIYFPLIGSIDLAAPVIAMGGTYINLSQLIRFIGAPLYVMVVANLVNMHSGFNGLQSGLSLMVLSSLLIKATIEDDLVDVVTVAAITGGLAGFWWFNRYPARFFEGNIGSMAVGATIGGFIVIQQYYVIGFVMLIPHIINFLMYAYWRIKRKMLSRQGRELGVYHHQIKFGKLMKDGTLEVPNRLTLKWFIPFHRPTTERQAVWYMYALTGAFCVLGILLPAY